MKLSMQQQEGQEVMHQMHVRTIFYMIHDNETKHVVSLETTKMLYQVHRGRQLHIYRILKQRQCANLWGRI